MRKTPCNFCVIIVTLISVMYVTGCVERIIAITTEPEGALVWLNGQEVGATPLEVPFTWYGEYEITIRKDGYESIQTSRETPVPVYQWPVIDFLAEALIPANFTDRHKWHYYLSEAKLADPNDLIQRAQTLRNQAITSFQD